MIHLERLKELEKLPEAEAADRIRAIRARYGKDVCLLAHLYQRKAITELADFVGDSFGLSQSAARFEGGKYIVFCGVRFMAESAAILGRPDQKVIHPDPEAGCPMADMAPMNEVKAAWEFLAKDGDQPIPVTYMNSTADIKAFCGERGGTICTSSNATKTFEWAYQRGKRIFFIPDEHLGRNTALKYGIAPEEISVWDPALPNGGNEALYGKSRAILWKGYCPVHQKFTVRDIVHIRKYFPKAKILVHPECPTDVVQAADHVGSTDFIRKWVAAESKPGDQIFIGTEINLVQNLAAQYKDRMIEKLHRSLCLTMYQITMGRLLYAMENLEELETVVIDDSVKHFARVALDRMLSLPG
jgi:quinolinate synthase